MSKGLIITNIILAAAIGFSGFTVSSAISNRETVGEVEENRLIKAEEAAEYIGVSTEFFETMIKGQEDVKEELLGKKYDYYNFIPWMYLDGEYVYDKREIDKWVEYNMMNKDKEPLVPE